MTKTEGKDVVEEARMRGSNRHPSTLEEQEAIYKRRIETYEITGGMSSSDIIKHVSQQFGPSTSEK